ncbi:unnamed protein product [Rotaria magnacalcarata]
MPGNQFVPPWIRQMIYCNTCIYLKVRETHQNKMTWNKMTTTSKADHRKRNMQRLMAKTIFFIINDADEL